MGTGISLQPIWWVEQNETELAIQVTHPEGARFADRAVSEAGAEVKVELATLSEAGGSTKIDAALPTQRIRQ